MPDVELGDILADEVAVVADRGETGPVVTVGNSGAACRDVEHRVDVVSTFGSTVAELPSNRE